MSRRLFGLFVVFVMVLLLTGIAQAQIVNTEFRTPTPPLGLHQADSHRLSSDAAEPDLQIAAIAIGIGEQYPYRGGAQAHGDNEYGEK